jgi:hypothetical protein
MTQDEVMQMMTDMGLHEGGMDNWVMDNAWYTFAKLVADKEREACHALRQTLPNPHTNCQVSAHAYDMAIVEYGRAIRARGEA